MDTGIIVLFVAGYAAILSEGWIRVNKAASALLMAVVLWSLLFRIKGWDLGSELLGRYVGEVSQIVLFLLGAMVVVELIDAHRGFNTITDLISTRSKRKLLFLIGMVTFFLSAVLDNLTTTIVMISLLRGLLPEREDRLRFGMIVVIAANAGGAWTPIGDVTTTMLWIQGKITSLAVMKALFLPSFLSFAVALSLALFSYRRGEKIEQVSMPQPSASGKWMFAMGVTALLLVPVLHALLGLPPFLSIFFGLALLWIITDRLHWPHEDREHLRIHRILTQVDTSGVLFFLAILLGVDALSAAGLLKELAVWLNDTFQSMSVVAIVIGIASAAIDNIPLVAAGMSMYAPISQDASLWHLLAYTAGTGGSMLLIGSAAGIAFMQMEKVTFLWYLKRAAPIAFVSYFVGIAIYFLQLDLFH